MARPRVHSSQVAARLADGHTVGNVDCVGRTPRSIGRERQEGEINMTENEKPLQSRFITQAEIADDMKCSRSTASRVVHQVNERLEAAGYIIPLKSQTLRRAYFEMTGEGFSLSK